MTGEQDLLNTLRYLATTVERLSVCHLKLEGADVTAWSPEMIDSVTKQAEIVLHWTLGNWDLVVGLAREWSDAEVERMEPGMDGWMREHGLDDGEMGH